MNLKKNWVRVKVPASSANLGPGYDVLGIALKLYNELELRVESKIKNSKFKVQFEIEGEGADSLPRDEKNIVWQAMKKVFSDCRLPIADCRFLIKLNNRIPLARGLGSSAAARLAGILSANALCGNFLSQNEVLNLAAKLEGHPDNVVPQLLGGLCISVFNNGSVNYVRLEPPKELRAVVCVPDFELSTKKARAVLPEKIPHTDAVYNLSRVALLLGAFSKKDYRLLKMAMNDRLHQNYRKKLVPGFDSVLKSGYESGALGMALSGAGPSILAFAPREKAKRIGRAMENGFRKAGAKAASRVLEFESSGAKVKYPVPLLSGHPFSKGE